MDFLLPQISVSPPPPEEPITEAYSPFSSISAPSERHQDTFRPMHLTPPSDLTAFFKKPLSPLRPLESVNESSGLERERFESLLRASRERNSLVGARKAIDLRKEITLKVHKSKQDERRARFLSKVHVCGSRPSTLAQDAADDSTQLRSSSPIFLSSSTGPSLHNEYECESWVKQYDENETIKEEIGKSAEAGTGRCLPSLDQISARLTPKANLLKCSRPNRLPDFLIESAVSTQDFSRSLVFNGINCQGEHIFVDRQQNIMEPVPRRASRSSTISAIISHSTSSYSAGSRERKALDMLSTIGRRTQPAEGDIHDDFRDTVEPRQDNWKRHSAPADLMPLQQRTGFEHPVLALPGGF